MKGQGEGIERVTREVKELTGTNVERGGTIGGGGLRVEFVRETGSDRERCAKAIVDGHAEEMFALAVALDDALKVFVAGAARKCFETFLEALGERSGAARKVIAEIAAFRAHLVSGVEKGDTNDADREG